MKTLSDFKQHVGSPLDRLYVAGHAVGNLGSGALFVDNLYAMPLIIPYSSRLDRVGIRVLGNQGGTVRIGLYEANSQIDLTPTRLLAQTEEIDTSAVGFKYAPVDWRLDGDTLYWLALAGNTNNMTIRFLTLANMVPLLGYDISLEAGASGFGFGFITNHTYGPLPARFPTPTVYPSPSGGPAIAYRIAV